MLLSSQLRFPYNSAERLRRVQPSGGREEGATNFSHVLFTSRFPNGKREKPPTLPAVGEAHPAGLRVPRIAQAPKVQELSHHRQVCEPAPLGTWHDSVVGEKQSHQVWALSLRNRVPAGGPAGRRRGAWSRSGAGAAAKLRRPPSAFLSSQGLVTLISPPSSYRGSDFC